MTKLVLFLSLSFASLIQASSLTSDRHFFNLKSEDLSDKYITDFYQDSNGFIWIATLNGLNRFDGHEVVAYQNIDGQENLLTSDYITDLEGDNQGRLWIATISGITRIDLNTYQFDRFPVRNPDNAISLQVNQILSSSDQSVWAATTRGLFRFKDDQFVQVSSPSPQGAILNKEIQALAEDKDGALWIGGQETGLIKYQPKNNTLQLTKEFLEGAEINDVSALIRVSDEDLLIGNYSGQLFKLDSNRMFIEKIELPPHDEIVVITSFAKDKEGKLWIGTRGQGLFIYDLITEEFSHYTHSDEIDRSILDNFIRRIYMTNNHKVWLATPDGVNIHDPDSLQFKHHYSNNSDENSIRNNSIWNLYVDPLEQVWVGHDEGLDVINNVGKKVLSLVHRAGDTNSLSNSGVRDVLQDPQGYYWIATRLGLDRYHPEDQSMKRYSHIKGDPTSLPGDGVYQLFVDHKERLWIGAYSGLVLYNPSLDNFTRIPEIANVPIYRIIETQPGVLWIASKRTGLYRFNTSTNEVQHFTHDPQDNNSLIHNAVYDIAFDGENVWIATIEGVNVLNTSTQLLERLDLDSKLLSNRLYRIELDLDKNLWISTTQGLAKLNTKTRELTLFTQEDGLQSQDFNSLASFYDTKKNRMYFGGPSGFNEFSPNEVKRNVTQSLPQVTELLLFNEQLTPNAQGILKKPVHLVSQVKLDHHQNSFSLKFSKMDISRQHRLSYSYRLDGLQPNWLNTLKGPIATFTNVPPGDYQLLVRMRNQNNDWSAPHQLITISIAQPFWATWWAYTLYLLVLLSVSSVIVYLKYRIVLATEKSKLAEQANTAKSNFLATMSHEIRTPINGVIGAVSLMSEGELNEEQMSYAKAIQVSGENLLYIVNDILDLSKIEAGEISLENHQFDLRNCIENSLDVFTSELDKKRVELILNAEEDVPREVISDSTRLRQVIVNLIGNAIKFTDKGTVSVNLSCLSSSPGQSLIRFSVKDSGTGIPIEKQAHIFDAFKQADESTTRHYGGTGLGLNISQKLVSILGGKIELNSSPNNGSEFHFSLPMKTTESTPSINSLPQLPNAIGKHFLCVTSITEQQQLFESITKQTKAELTFCSEKTSAWKLLVSSQKIDLIIINNNFDDNSSLFLTEQIRKEKALQEIPIILLSSPHFMHLNQDKIDDLSISALLKPLKYGKLAAKINSLLGSSPQSQAAASNKLRDTFSTDYPFRVLLAEDNAVNQKLLLFTFRKLGYEPDIVSDGQELLDAVGKKDYDIVLTDNQMPHIGGLEAAQQIKRTLTENAPVIILISADVTSDFSAELDSNIIQEILPKPLNITSLKECLIKYSHSKSLNCPP